MHEWRDTEGISDVSSLCQVQVEGVDTKALTDTGSGVSLISDSFRDRYEVLRNRKIDRNISLCATSVNNEPVDLLGSVRMNITIGGVDTEVPFYVARGVTYSILLGWDFIRQRGLVIDGQAGVIHIVSTTNPLIPKWRVFPRVCAAKARITEDIPARSEKIIQVLLEPGQKCDVVLDGFTGVLEPEGVMGNSYAEEGLMVARTAGVTKNGTTLVGIMNVSSSAITLPETA